MRTFTCTGCGAEVAEDDYIVQQCPLCDGFLQASRLDKKVDSEISAVIRVTSAKTFTLVE